MLSQAHSIYKLSIERPKSDMDRDQGYQQRDWSRIAEGVSRAQRTIEPKSDRAGLKYFLAESQKLPVDQRIKPVDDAIARAGSVDALLDQLYANTKLADLNERKAMQGEYKKAGVEPDPRGVGAGGGEWETDKRPER